MLFMNSSTADDVPSIIEIRLTIDRSVDKVPLVIRE
jgi:hypothetical protein